MKLDSYFAETNVLILAYLRETFRGLQSWTETFQRGVPILLQAQFFELKASIQAKLDFMMSQALCKQRVCTFWSKHFDVKGGILPCFERAPKVHA